MKPFDLEKALAGEPVVTRDGMPVKIAGYNPDCVNPYGLAGWVNNELCTWKKDGRWHDTYEDDDDLFMAEKPKVKREGWVIINLNTFSPAIDEMIFTSKGDADMKCSYKSKNCVVARIEWEEEQ